MGRTWIGVNGEIFKFTEKGSKSMEKIALPLNLDSTLAVYGALAIRLRDVTGSLQLASRQEHSNERQKLLDEASEILESMQLLNARIDELSE